MTELHKSFGPLFNPATPEDYKPVAKDLIAKRFAYVDAHLAKGGPFLLGSQFTVADAYLFVMTLWSSFLKIDVAQWPSLKAYAERVGGRPGVREALKEEGCEVATIRISGPRAEGDLRVGGRGFAARFAPRSSRTCRARRPPAE